MTFWMNFFLKNLNFFFSTPKSQKSNPWCLKVLSSSQNLLHHIPVLYVKCPISILQNSWQLKILWKLPLFELDSKAALARSYLLCFLSNDVFRNLLDIIHKIIENIHHWRSNSMKWYWCATTTCCSIFLI